MKYTLHGRLHGWLCDDCNEPLANAAVRVYRAAEKPPVVAGQDGRPHLFSAAEVEERRGRLLGEGRVDEGGSYRVELGENARYDGGPVEVDVRLETVPRIRENRRKEPVKFTAGAFDPAWDRGPEGRLARWDHGVVFPIWCWLRSLFDAWVICGHLRDCEKGIPLAGVTVRAFDADWLQDDALGWDVTAVDGHFRIDYTSAQFRKTPFSPWINLEMTEGPDLYFRVESGGDVILDEKQADGWQPKRRNVSHCFCVDLCVDLDVPPPYFSPLFTSVGKLEFGMHVDAATGLTNAQAQADTGVVGAGYGFFGGLALGGLCPSKTPGTGEPMFYRFRVAPPGVSDAAAVPVTGTQVVPDKVGSRLILWDKDGNGTLEYVPQPVWLKGSGATPGLPAPLPAGTPGLPPQHVIVPDPATGWIAVEPDARGQSFQVTLLRLNSAAIVPGGAAPGNGPGQDVAAKRSGKRIRVIFETTTDPANPAATVTQSDVAVLLVNNWNEVRELNLQQLMVGGGGTPCSALTTQMNVLYTVDHELLGDWGISIHSAASGWSVAPPPLPSSTNPPAGATARGAFGDRAVPIGGWPACSYTVVLTSVRKLTTGEGNDQPNQSALTFCIRENP